MNMNISYACTQQQTTSMNNNSIRAAPSNSTSTTTQPISAKQLTSNQLTPIKLTKKNVSRLQIQQTCIKREKKKIKTNEKHRKTVVKYSQKPKAVSSIGARARVRYISNEFYSVSKGTKANKSNGMTVKC